jgi:hypothetical protein
MRIQEISGDSRIGENDLLLGSMFIEKGRYKNKNFSIKDIIQHIRSGLHTENGGGKLLIQYAFQDEDSPYTTVEDLLNKYNGTIEIPANGILFVKMVRNVYGMPCDNLFLFKKTDCKIGEEEYPVNSLNFIEIRSENLNRGIELDDSVILNNGYHRGLIFLTNTHNIEITLPADLYENFEATFIRQGMGEVEFRCDRADQSYFIKGTMIEADGKVDLYRNKSNQSFTIYGNTK